MTYADSSNPLSSTLSRRGEQMVGWMRELEECRIGGLVTDEEYGLQRAEKFAALLRPTRWLWLASLLGMALIGAPAASLTWGLTQDSQYTAAIGVLAGGWGFLALGRLLREKAAEFQLSERRKILVALLEMDILTAGEFADYDDRLSRGEQNIA